MSNRNNLASLKCCDQRHTDMQDPNENLDPLRVRDPVENTAAGRASFILALIFGGLSFLLILALAGVRIANQVGHGADQPLENLLRLVVMLSLAGNLVGLVLGIKGVNPKGHNTSRAGVGLALNGLVLAGGVLFMISYFLYGL
jgi:hypothetical protein